MSFDPNWVSQPSNTINNILLEKRISVDCFAEQLNWKIEKVQKLLDGEINIDEKIAFALQETLGSTQNFWLKRQQIYTQRNKQLIEERKEWVKLFPTKEMVNLGWINDSKDLLKECLTFFGISTIRNWDSTYKNGWNVSFRKSPSFESEFPALSVWVRRAELITQDFKIKKWNKTLFEEKLQTEIKSLIRTKKNPTHFLPCLAEICAECGVALAVVPKIGKSHASGASKFLSKDRALIILSFRHLSDDHFWFTFFHEAGHLIMHEYKKEIKVNIDQNDDEENDANFFAAECLIPSPIRGELETLRSNKRKIISFSQKANVSPGIVIGQLQFNKLIPFNYLNDYKRKYTWDDINCGIQQINSLLLNS